MNHTEGLYSAQAKTIRIGACEKPPRCSAWMRQTDKMPESELDMPWGSGMSKY